MNKPLKILSPEEKLKYAELLYTSARELKKAALRTFYPKMTEAEIEKKVREIFLNGKT